MSYIHRPPYQKRAATSSESAFLQQQQQPRRVFRRSAAWPTSTDTQSNIPLPKSAYMTYAEVARQGPPQPPVEESYHPVLFHAQRKLRVWTAPHDFPKSPLRYQEMYVARQDNPQQGYRRVRGKAPISLDHHGAGWGYVIVCIVFDRLHDDSSKSSSTDGNNTDPNKPPSRYQQVVAQIEQYEQQNPSLLSPDPQQPRLLFNEPDPTIATSWP